MYQDLFTQIAHSDGCDNGTNLSQRLLKGQVRLLVSVEFGGTWSARGIHVDFWHESLLAQLSLERANILDAVFEDHVLGRELILDFRGELFDVFALVLDLDSRLATW